MAYALFAQRKLTLRGQINTIQMMQSQRADEQERLASNTLSLKQRVSNLQIAQRQELGVLYKQLTSANSSERETINNQLKEKENEFEIEKMKFEEESYETSEKENAIEMEVKRLDTRLTAMLKQLEAIEEAEGDGIDKATPKFKGIS